MLTTMKVAPNAPPVQTHHGARGTSPKVGEGCRVTTASRISSSSPTMNCPMAAQNGPPSTTRRRALIND